MKPYFKYFSLCDARTKFAIDTKMLKTIKTHFSSDREYTEDLWQCEAGCGRIDSIRHVEVCPGYEEFRVNRDLEDTYDYVHYFQDVLQFRMGVNEFV